MVVMLSKEKKLEYRFSHIKIIKVLKIKGEFYNN